MQTGNKKALDQCGKSYRMVVDLCKRELDEMFEEGLAYFDLFAEFVFDVYSEIDKETSAMFDKPESEHKKHIKLKEFIKKDVFDDFLKVYIAGVGTYGLIKV